MNLRSSLFLIVFGLSIPLSLLSQAQNNSIFSRFGLGDLVPQNFVNLSGMGFAASGFNSSTQTNTVNPASYSFLDKTSFDLGISAKYYTVDTDEAKYTNWTGALDYISLAFPLFNSINTALDPIERKYDLGMCFALQQYSRVGYNITSVEAVEQVGQIERNYTGFGGLNKIIWGNSLKYNNFSAGINLAYYFGKISYEKNILYADYINPFNTSFTNSFSANGLAIEAGLMYNWIINQEDVEEKSKLPNQLSFGLHYSNKSSINSKATFAEFNFLSTQGTTVVDTLRFEDNVKGKITLPSQLGIGVSYKHGIKWGMSAAFSQGNWSAYQNEAEPISLKDVQSYNVGFYYIPKYNSITSFFERVNYKLGFFSRTDPTSFDENQVTNTGITMGLGFPIIYQRKSSVGDLSMVLGRRNGGSIINENYLELRFGFSFNDDEWFLKRKYN